ncbi:chorismate synthase [Lutibacter sp. B2]|nr:chorismate synthase [Lutibacter sp. B2]
MSSVWGHNIKLSLFGESHGKAIGIVIDGLPAGIKLDLEYISNEMKRRAPGKNKLATARKEKDEFEIISGYFNEYTTGTPLCTLIYNTNQRSRDYEATKHLMRPGHADYTGHIRYSGFEDFRGGGHFSGRLTAPLVFAGAIAKQILKQKNIFIGSHIKSIGNVCDNHFDPVNLEINTLEKLMKKEIPVIDEAKGKQMQEVIIRAKEEGDSVGGIIETVILNVEQGIGSPFFCSIESEISRMLFSIPGVKGVEFGDGFDISRMKGSEANDEYFIENEKVKTYTNHNGGILGGITNGMPILFKTAIKPTPSISKLQRTVNIKENKNTQLEIDGRHDPCIVPRAVPVVESAAAIVILDFLMGR